VPEGGFPDRFPFGQCTYWAAYNYPVTWNGDARDWLRNAQAQGVPTDMLPSVGAVAVFRPGGLYSEYGHVAIVVAAGPSSYTVSEMNAPRWGEVSTRVLRWPDPGIQGFIPFREVDGG
jgi:surface antigen